MIISEGCGACVCACACGGGKLPADFPNAKHNQFTQVVMSRNTSPSPQKTLRAMDGQSPEAEQDKLFISRSSSDQIDSSGQKQISFFKEASFKEKRVEQMN